MGKLARYIEYLFFPPYCPGCREVYRTNPDESHGLCRICGMKWEQEKMQLCGNCGLPFSECLCMPDVLSKAGASALIKLVPYKPSAKNVASSVVLYLKDNRDKRIFGFVANQLSVAVMKYCRDNLIDLEKQSSHMLREVRGRSTEPVSTRRNSWLAELPEFAKFV